jgi:hypothetical protein
LFLLAVAVVVLVLQAPVLLAVVLVLAGIENQH